MTSKASPSARDSAAAIRTSGLGSSRSSVSSRARSSPSGSIRSMASRRTLARGSFHWRAIVRRALALPGLRFLALAGALAVVLPAGALRAALALGGGRRAAAPGGKRRGRLCLAPGGRAARRR